MLFVETTKMHTIVIAGDCPDGWLMYEGKCYGHPKDNKLSWADAESYCQSWSAGAHLASVHSAEEQKFVQENFPQNIWLGGSDTDKEGSWIWWRVNSSPVAQKPDPAARTVRTQRKLNKGYCGERFQWCGPH